MQKDVTEDAGPKDISPRHQPIHLLGLDAIEATTKPRLKVDVAVRGEHEGVQTLLTKLPVAGPHLTRLPGSQRRDVDEDR